MSLEESMLKLAESNLALAEAQNALAEKYERILNGEAAIDPAVVAGAKTEAAPAKKGPGRPAKAKTPEPEPEPEEKEDDGLGGEEEEEAEVVTADQVKKALQEYKAAGGAPKDIMSKYGAKAFPEIKEADYAACLAATIKATAKL